MKSLLLSGRIIIAGVILAAGLLSCEDEVAPPPPPDSPGYTVETRVIRDIDFIKNRYFWINDPDYGGLPADPNHPTISIDVWQEINPADKLADPPPDWMPGKAFYDQNGDGSALDFAARQILNGVRPSAAFVQEDFKRLELGRDYQLMLDFDTKEISGIVLVRPVPEDKALAVNYISVEWAIGVGPFVVGGPYSQYGIPVGGGAERDTMILELIKTKNPRPGSGLEKTWDFMMRNFYDLGLNYIAPAYTEIEIEDQTPRHDRTHPEGSDVPYIRIFGFDRQNRAFEPIPDGNFDMPSIYLDTTWGILQFPAGFGFAPPPDSVSQWTGGEFSFADSVLYQDRWTKVRRLYTEYLIDPFVDAHQYNIVVRVKHYE
jgi:hypothetical protein